MFYLSIKSEIIHKSSCRYIKRIKNAAVFYHLAEAPDNVYLCRFCFRDKVNLQKQIMNEKKMLIDFAKKHLWTVTFFEHKIEIKSQLDSWKLLRISGSDSFLVYHKNRYVSRKNPADGMYHLQKDIKKNKSLLKICRYIDSHDCYRRSQEKIRKKEIKKRNRIKKKLKKHTNRFELREKKEKWQLQNTLIELDMISLC